MPIQCALHPHADSSARQCRPKSRKSSTSDSSNEHCPPRTRVYFLMELDTGGELQGPLARNQAGLRSAMAVSQRARKWRFVRSRSFAGMVIDSAFAHEFAHWAPRSPATASHCEAVFYAGSVLLALEHLRKRGAFSATRGTERSRRWS